ncbi:MAG: hypothetical protein CM15mP8_1440 [Methanobacteriota archaeon]|nr:MAG: hypothetical protein CM15mP8_1440 [Euryarchaeota archaeon]
MVWCSVFRDGLDWTCVSGFCAHHLVVNASDLAYEMNIPHSIIGTVVSGLGTSLPELTIASWQPSVLRGVIGTLIGSNITDPLLSLERICSSSIISNRFWF